MKKLTLLLASLLVMSVNILRGQSAETINNFLLLKGNNSNPLISPTGDTRTFLKLRNDATISSSLVSIELSSGSGTGASTFLSHQAREYDYPDANGAFAGFGQIYSRDNGLILRAGSPQNPYGIIKFMTGNQVQGNLSLERMRIDMIGNVGIGTQNPQAKLQITNGDVYIENPDRGIIMKSPNGLCWRVTIDNLGNFVRTQINCP